MKNLLKCSIFVWHLMVLLTVVNAVYLVNTYGKAWYLILAIPYFIFINILPNPGNQEYRTTKLRNSAHGCALLELFLASTFISSVFTIYKICQLGFGDYWRLWTGQILVIILVESILFWNGIIRIYVTSQQLGIKWRIIGAICGWIPVVHLIVLGILLYKVHSEINFENNKLILNERRSMLQLCNTKYPILMVHGVFFRDSTCFNYWGRIPEELEKNGARIFYGNHQSAASVANSGQELAQRIRQVLEETGAPKVNIIAHSKGGLDCRYAISMLGMDEYVASLTTINTPHRGCEFADYLLNKIPQKQQQLVAGTYNAALKRFGDYNPDFLAAVYDLTHSACDKLNQYVFDSDKVFYQSVGSKLNVASSGRFPLNMSYHLVNYFDGNNDGLVGEKSFPWGQRYKFITVNGNRGVSHGDMIDLNRENIAEFDVREFYVGLVSELKNMGY